MNKNTGIVIGVIVLVAIAGGIYASVNSKNDAMVVNDKLEQQAMEDKKTSEDTEAKMEKENTGPADQSEAMMKAGSYEAYSAKKVAMASTEHDVVLFFRAGWCPTCRVVDADIKANLGKIPSDLTILDVNYDDSTALKQKYGVTYQHTFVQVDGDGSLIKKWSGSPTLAALVAEVK